MEICLFGLVFYLPDDYPYFVISTSLSSIASSALPNLKHQFHFGAPHGVVLHSLYSETVSQLVKKISQGLYAFILTAFL